MKRDARGLKGVGSRQRTNLRASKVKMITRQQIARQLLRETKEGERSRTTRANVISPFFIYPPGSRPPSRAYLPPLLPASSVSQCFLLLFNFLSLRVLLVSSSPLCEGGQVKQRGGSLRWQLEKLRAVVLFLDTIT